MKIFLAISCLLMALAVTTRAQSPTPTPRECDVPTSRQVDTKLRILAKPDPNFSQIDGQRHHHETIILRAIFCGSGKVTDISVTKGLTAEMNAAAIAAARLIEFTPAEKDGQKVSTVLNLKYFVK